ncbi:hypothetical protein [Halothece sp. PCC 7418]|uniref:hypothetical protein n=1 Tax=Halothece sp. (strain PCC 7418) TaxID=65093 RepID=UPI0002DEEB2E|nr:hypothetical protein [Halothece sp. PCC 7418]
MGILKDWLSTTLHHVLTQDKPATTITLEDLKPHALPARQCLKLLTDIKTQEKDFQQSKEESALTELRTTLGIEYAYIQSSESQEKESSSGQGKNTFVGEPSPHRYPTGIPDS